LYSADVANAVMSDITLDGASVYNTGISVGGEYP